VEREGPRAPTTRAENTARHPVLVPSLERSIELVVERAALTFRLTWNWIRRIEMTVLFVTPIFGQPRGFGGLTSRLTLMRGLACTSTKRWAVLQPHRRVQHASIEASNLHCRDVYTDAQFGFGRHERERYIKACDSLALVSRFFRTLRMTPSAETFSKRSTGPTRADPAYDVVSSSFVWMRLSISTSAFFFCESSPTAWLVSTTSHMTSSSARWRRRGMTRLAYNALNGRK